MEKFEVAYSIRGSITIEANSKEEAEEMLLSSDHTGTEELFEGLRNNIEDIGNDAITIDDVYKK